MTPSVGRIVHYTLTYWNAQVINNRRSSGMSSRVVSDSGFVVHDGNPAREGDVLPMIITRVWEAGMVNGQVLLDGNDTLWVTSVPHGTLRGGWTEPPRV